MVAYSPSCGEGNITFGFTEPFLLQGSADEVLLREVLYDAAIIPDYLFIKLQFGTERPALDLRTTCLNWLFVAENGIRTFRYNKS